MSSAEAIAAVVADLKAGRVVPLPEKAETTLTALTTLDDPTVVDATAIWRSIKERHEPIFVYEDHPCVAPPWDEAAVGFVNSHGNVTVMHVRATEGWEPWSSGNDIDWPRVKWVTEVLVYVGGYSKTARRHIPTAGPGIGWRIATYEDGTPQDIRWIQFVKDKPRDIWDIDLIVTLAAMNFCNCRNVELVEPRRSRPEARRLARLGVQVHEINVLPVSRTSRGGHNRSGQGTPLTSVRGHFARYGPQYGRKLLFGKYAGRYWIAQHARGSAELGQSKPAYRLTPEGPGDGAS